MKSLLIRLIAAASLLVLGSTHVLGNEPAYRVPDTSRAQQTTNLLQQGAQAISTYVAACAAHDWGRLNRATTADAVFEFPLADPGTSFSLESSSLEKYCGTGVQGASILNIWAFPTNDASSVFVNYELAVGNSAASTGTHLVLVTLQNGRIARLRDFTADADLVQSLVAKAARVRATTR